MKLHRFWPASATGFELETATTGKVGASCNRVARLIVVDDQKIGAISPDSRANLFPLKRP
jgi:hypothetical protein